MYVSPHLLPVGSTDVKSQTAVASLQTPSLTQSITHAILDSWGYDGFKTHTEAVSAFYREKRDVFESAMRKHLTGLAEWDTPEAGMFFWCAPFACLPYAGILM